MKKIILLLVLLIGVLGYSETEELKMGKEYFLSNRLKEAEKYFKLAEEKGDISAYRELGRLYFYMKRLDLSEEYYKKSVESGDDYSCYRLGNLYTIQKKEELAKEYYILGAERGSSGAQYELDVLEGRKKKMNKVGDMSLLEMLERNSIMYENEKAAGRMRS